MTVRELSREQLAELKSNYFWSDDYNPKIVTESGLPVLFPGDIPDKIIFAIYDGTDFVNDDFFCTCK